MPVKTSSRIQEKFSKAAGAYERLATLQQTIGLRLLETVKGENPRRILDIGMGTGWLTGNFCAHFMHAEVIGMDFAIGMIEHAKKKPCRFKTIQADAAAIPLGGQRVDLAVSNLAYQWAGDLKEAFAEVFRVVGGGGSFYLSMFGPRTLCELAASLKESQNGSFKEIPAMKFPDKEAVTNALMQSGFSGIHVTHEDCKVFFSDTPTLVRWLKNIGANVPEFGGKNAFLGREFLRKTDEHYRRYFSRDGKIYATFEVIWAKAKK